MITLILTFKQAKYLLEHLPEGHNISIMAADLNRILDYDKPKKKHNEDYSGGTQSIGSQPQQGNNTGLQPQNNNSSL